MDHGIRGEEAKADAGFVREFCAKNDIRFELAEADSYIIEAAVPYTDADIKYQDNNCRANKEQYAPKYRTQI